MNDEKLHHLLCEALEAERGGVQVYRAALACAVNEDLKAEWREYLEQIRNHERILCGLLEDLELDADVETPGRKVVRHIGESLVKAMQMAREDGDASAAQLVAAQCVVEAETKDHMNWELIGLLARKARGETGRSLRDAYDEVEDEEDEHLYHTRGWARELWTQSLGMPAVLPPPEEAMDVKVAIGAARAKKARRDMKKAS